MGVGMIDTIVVNTTPVSETDLDKIEKKGLIRNYIDGNTGQQINRFVSTELEGSFDNRIRINVRTDKWVRKERNGELETYKEECAPYLRIECSLHKLIVGHNIYGGSDKLKEQLRYLMNLINDVYEIKLSELDNWIITRLDYAKIYEMKSKEECLKWIQTSSNNNYPRREVNKYKTSIYVPGTTTTLKIYHKGSEFKKHDSKRISKYFTQLESEQLQKIADRIMRFELEVHNKKLKDLNNGDMLVKDLKIEDIKTLYDKEVKKFMKIIKSDVEVVRTMDLVERRLVDLYGYSEGNSLFGTWVKLATQEYRKVREGMKRSTFYKHKSQLEQAGCDWVETDVTIIEEDGITGFLPIEENEFIMSSPLMNEVVNKYKEVA